MTDGKQRIVLTMFGGLGGDFCKDTYEPKLFGMHSGSGLSGLDAANANTDLNMSILPICRVGNVYVHSIKRVVFSVFWRSWRGLLQGHI